MSTYFRLILGAGLSTISAPQGSTALAYANEV